MITKVQGKTLAGELAISQEPKLTALERAMLRWAVVDPDDKLLDANVGAGMMAEYLRRNMQCEVCGVSDHMDHVRYARSRLQTCDIVYAPAGDIPWREDSFDTVLMRLSNEEPDLLHRMFNEARRVLKPGGQLILGVACYPLWLKALAELFSIDDKHRLQSRKLQQMLGETQFETVSWERTGLTCGVMIAWKHKPDAKNELKD